MKSEFFAAVIATALFALPAISVAQTQSCDRFPLQYRCDVVDSTPSGNHLIVRQMRLSDDDVMYLIVSNLFQREYRAGLHVACSFISEVGVVCNGPGMVQMAEFHNVNGIELARFEYSTGRATKTTLCGRNVPLDYNEGPVVGDIQFTREAANESATPGQFLFSGDPALRTSYEVNKLLIKPQDTRSLISLFDSNRNRWELVNWIDSPGLTNARFGTVQCVANDCGSFTDIGERFAGRTQAFVLSSDLGDRFYQGKGGPRLVLLPNGTVDNLKDSLCQEYPGMDPRPN